MFNCIQSVYINKQVFTSFIVLFIIIPDI